MQRRYGFWKEGVQALEGKLLKIAFVIIFSKQEPGKPLNKSPGLKLRNFGISIGEQGIVK
jgi:hypothetical protein